MWSEADLARRLCLALDMAGRAVSLMAADGFTDPDDASLSIRPEKVVGETALLLLAAAPLMSNGDIRKRVDLVARRLEPYARAERVRARICLEPSLSLEHALAHICLSRLGYLDPGLDALLAASLEADGAGGCERLPHRQLEQEWMLRTWFPWANSTACAPRIDSRLPRRTALGRPTDLLSLRKDDAYAFTHALMYLTDLGGRRARPPRSGAILAAEADAVLASCLDEPDYDLGGEILLTWPYLQRRWSASANAGFAILASVEDRVGFLPSPGVSLKRANTLSGEERERYVLSRSYHTAFVMGLLCAAALSEGRRPSARIPARGAPRGAAAEFLALIGPINPKPDWRAYMEALPEAEQDAAAALLFNICLRRAASRRDLSALRAALLAGQRHGLLDAPAPRQAAQLLRRGARFADIFPSAGAAPPA